MIQSANIIVCLESVVIEAMCVRADMERDIMAFEIDEGF